MMSIEKALDSLKRYTVEEFQEDFDNLMNLVENDKKSFIITSEHGEAVIIPADDELIRIHTELNNEAP
jgi:PHD/YefM family antitoxin component YafN of YafNO toxin-antitoxin module